MLSLRFVIVVALLSFTARSALATDAGQCIEAHESGLKGERSGALLASRDHFATCANAICPRIVRDECALKLRAVTASIPSLVVVATDGDGDVTAARLLIDDVAVREELDGLAIEVDPGPHRVAVITDRGRAETSVLVGQGERERRVQLHIGAESELAPATDAPLVHPAAWVMGGLGLAGFAVFAIAGALGLDKEAALRKCAPRCAQDQIDIMRTRYLVADVGLVIGATGVATALVLAIALAPDADDDGPAAMLQLGPGSLLLRARF